MNQSPTIPMSSGNDLSRKTAGTPLGAIGRGLIAGAAGSLAMDVLWYARYRRGGGKQHFLAWQFSAGLSGWDQAPVPGQAHLVYGTTTAAAHRLLSPSTRHPRNG